MTSGLKQSGSIIKWKDKEKERKKQAREEKEAIARKNVNDIS